MANSHPPLIPFKAEGAPLHPDSFGFDGSDDRYLQRLQAYADYHGLEVTKRTECSRPHLLERLT